MLRQNKLEEERINSQMLWVKYDKPAQKWIIKNISQARFLYIEIFKFVITDKVAHRH